MNKIRGTSTPFRKLLLEAFELSQEMQSLGLMFYLVTIGGGSGHAQLARACALIRGTIRALRVSNIVGVSDNGGSSWFFQRVLGVFALGDLAKVMFSTLPEHSRKLEKRFAGRFKDLGQALFTLGLANVSLRNTVLALALNEGGICQESIDGVTEDFGLLCRGIPVTLRHVRLDWYFRTRKGEHSTIPGQRAGAEALSANKWEKFGDLWRIEVAPELNIGPPEAVIQGPIEMNPAADEAIEQMDAGVLAPGSQIDSIAATLRTADTALKWQGRDVPKFAFGNHMVPEAIGTIEGFVNIYRRFGGLSQEELDKLRLIISTSDIPLEALAAYAEEGMVPMLPNYGRYTRSADDPRGAHIEADLRAPLQQQDPRDKTRRSLLVHDPEKMAIVLLEHIIIPGMKRKLAEHRTQLRQEKGPKRDVA